MPKKKRSKKALILPKILLTSGHLFVGIAVLIVVVTYGRVIWQEIAYTARQSDAALPETIEPVDREFGIVIPKIGANAAVIPGVDPYNSREYQFALTKGVAHAKGTGIPGVAGNMFLFSHSSVNFYDALRYNSIFYLLTKLEPTDPIYVYFRGQKYEYTVTSKALVSPTAVEYLSPYDNVRETLTLMTCWPPGTTYKRLLVIAERTR